MKELPDQHSNGRSSRSMLGASKLGSRRKEAREVMKKWMKRLKAEMEEIGKEQESIRRGQEEVRGRLHAVGAQCRHLRHETQLLVQQSAQTTIRLQLMLHILRARDNHDSQTAAQLTLRLRELVMTNDKTS